MAEIESIELDRAPMRHWLLLLILTAIFLPATAHAAAGEWQRAEGASARLISSADGVGDEPQVTLGLEIALDPNWHTYWRSPGEAGLPPQFDWRNSLTDDGNLQSARLLYPAPHRYTAYGLETIGYRDHVIFPVEARLRVPGKPLNIDASLSLLVCSDICVPKNFALHLTIPAGPATPGAETPALDAAKAQVPGDPEKAGIVIPGVIRSADAIVITVASSRPFTAPDVFVENDKSVDFAKPEIASLSGDRPTETITLKLASPLPEGVTLAALPFTLTFIDGATAFEQAFDPSATAPPPEQASAPIASPAISAAPIAPQQAHSLGAIILLAILGGFILNLMPCVLPVLSLKILNVVSHGGSSIRRVRRSFLMTAAGILFSFFVLAVVTIALKETGHVIGWGVQFQQPAFLVLLILLLTIFAANLWEQFQIPLPRFLIDRIDPHYHPKLAGDFATGAFATLLATPCTAPFLGTAVGFALASGATEILLIFMALGFGMTLPYLAIAFRPRLAIRLPKPGAWMLTMRRILGGALSVTAIWLLWVLAAEISLPGVVVIGGSMLALLGVLNLRRRRKFRKAFPASLCTIIAIPFLITFFTHAPAQKDADGSWHKFDEASIARYVAEGKTVFVDVTADWCLTCKANKKFTLASDEVTARLFKDPNVVALQADWTNPDPVIARFLKDHGRYGIPFNAVFGPAMPQGITLPELLSPSLVLDGLNKASNKF